MTREQFLEECMNMECVKTAEYKRGGYVIKLKDNYYSFYRGVFRDSTLFDYVTSMKDVKSWLKDIHYIEKNMEHYKSVYKNICDVKYKIYYLNKESERLEKLIKSNNNSVDAKTIELGKLVLELNQIEVK